MPLISIFSPKSAHYFTKLLKNVYKIARPYIFHRIGPHQSQSCVNMCESLNLCLGQASVFEEDVTEGSHCVSPNGPWRPLSEAGYWATEHGI